MVIDTSERNMCPIQEMPTFLKQAYTFAEACYAYHTHQLGDSYYTYVCEIADTLQYIQADHETIAASLLYHLPALTGIHLHEIQKHCNADVRYLIEEVLSLDKIEWNIQPFLLADENVKNISQRQHNVAELQEHISVVRRMFLLAIDEPINEDQLKASDVQALQFFQKQSKQLENLIRMFLVAATDVRALVIKLAERLQFLKRLLTFERTQLEASNCRLYAEMTLQVYAPLADRLGIWPLKSQLEDLAFQLLNPNKFQEITEQLALEEEERERYIHSHIIPTIEEVLSIFDIKAKISGRAKHVYSIHHKMEARQLTFEQLNDVLGVRIIVNTPKECYDVQAILHARWMPLTVPYEGKAGRDWIAKPKENEYQSLHTTVMIDGKEVEVQIRTPKMHEVAEYGVAAHWRYKELKPYSKGQAKSLAKEKEVVWTEQLVELRKQLANATELPEPKSRTKGYIYVITPLGHVIDLREGATPLDFAYRIHTYRGHRYAGAKVGGRIVRTDYRLQNGDIVELLPPRIRVGPSSEWLSKSRDENGKSDYIFARTRQARSKITQWLNAHKQQV